MDNTDNKKNHNDDTNEADQNNDVVYETDSENGFADAKDKLDKLKDRLKKCEAEKMEYLDGWQRAKADAINSRKRDEESAKALVKFANENIISDLIPVLDSFDMAFGNKEAWEKAPKDWRMGIEYIYNQLIAVLKNNGVRQINPIGEIFDHNLHASIEMIPVEDKSQDGKIIQVVQKGYELNGRLVREAKVKVGEYEVKE